MFGLVSIGAFLHTNWLRLLQLGAAVLAVVILYFNTKNAGKMAEKVDQYEAAIKARKRVDAIDTPSDDDTARRLRDGNF
jgi:hypothetical protein